MDRRRAIIGVLEGKRSSRLPRALFGAGRWAYRQTGLRIGDLTEDPGHFADALTGLFSRLDTDIIFPGSGLNSFAAEAIGGELVFSEEKAPMLSFPLIQSSEDAAGLASIDISDSPHGLGLIGMIRGLRKGLPDRFLCCTSWGPFTWAMILCDWNLLKDKTVTDRAFIHEVCELGVRLSFSLFRPLIDEGLIDGIVIPDGAVTLIPNDLYREVVLPAEKRLFDLARARGLWCFLHQCGDIRPQISLYPGTGADCISVDSRVSLREVYELYRQRVVTAGNVDVINTILGGDPSLLCKAVSESLAGVDPFERFILMPSCDLPPETPFENVRTFLSCADRVVPTGV
ncbi:MAG: hypothetical protein EPN25_00810 [Nitrospirae bacterium]|nr:MAG: hypothetical protein EPN25_00810 [Nitrospirota bacterium]